MPSQTGFSLGTIICGDRDHRDHDDHRGGHDRDNRVRGHDLNDGRVQPGHDYLPSSQRNIVLRRGAVESNAPPRTVDESNNLRATYNAFRPGTNNPPPTYNRAPGLAEPLQPRVMAVVHQ